MRNLRPILIELPTQGRCHCNKQPTAAATMSGRTAVASSWTSATTSGRPWGIIRLQFDVSSPDDYDRWLLASCCCCCCWSGSFSSAWLRFWHVACCGLRGAALPQRLRLCLCLSLHLKPCLSASVSVFAVSATCHDCFSKCGCVCVVCVWVMVRATVQKVIKLLCGMCAFFSSL